VVDIDFDKVSKMIKNADNSQNNILNTKDVISYFHQE